jgi:hypothetical protein
MKIGLLSCGLAAIAAMGHAHEPLKSNVCDLFESPQAHLGELIAFDAFIVYDESAWVTPAEECPRRIGIALPAAIEQVYEDPIFLRSRDQSTSEKPYAVRLTVEGKVMPWGSDGELYFAVTEYRDARLVISKRAYDWFPEPPPEPTSPEEPDD